MQIMSLLLAAVMSLTSAVAGKSHEATPDIALAPPSTTTSVVIESLLMMDGEQIETIFKLMGDTPYCETDPGDHPDVIPAYYRIIGYEPVCPGTGQSPPFDCVADLQGDIINYINGVNKQFRQGSCNCVDEYADDPAKLAECLVARYNNGANSIENLIGWYETRVTTFCCPVTP